MQAQQSIHTAILLEPMTNNAIQVLTKRRTLCMLPIAGKTVLQVWLEQLNLAGVKQVIIGVRDFPEAVKELVGDGARWGLNVQVQNIPTAATQTQALKQLLSLGHSDIADSPVFWVNLNTLALQSMASISELKLINTSDVIDNVELVTLVSDSLFSINCPKELFYANLAMHDGYIFDPNVTGYETEPGLFTDIGLQIKRDVHKESPARIGHNCLVESNTRIGSHVFVGNEVIIERGCELTNALVFDHSHIGSQSRLDNVIIDGQLVCDLDTGINTWVNDPAILGCTNMRSQNVNPAERVAASGLLFLFSPLICAFVLNRLMSGKTIAAREEGCTFLGVDLFGNPNYQMLSLLTLNTQNRYLRKLPWLVQVISGKLHLSGTKIPSNPQFSIPDWAHELREQRPAVINLQDLEHNARCQDESLVDDLFYLANTNVWFDLKLTAKWFTELLKTLFTTPNKVVKHYEN